MKRLSTIWVVAVLMGAMWSIALAGGEQKPHETELIFGSIDEAKFEEVVPGVSKAALWGDHDEGPYGAFTRFEPGTDNGMHTHTNDVRIVVLEGAYVYKDDAGEKRVGSGDFIQIPGGTKHWSGGDEESGALFYEESPGGFDLVPASRD